MWCVGCKQRVPYQDYFFCFLCDSGGCRCSLALADGHWMCAGCEHEAPDLLHNWYSSAAEVPQSSVQTPAMTQRMDTPPTLQPLWSTPSSSSTPLAQGTRVKAPPPPPPPSLPPTPTLPTSLGPARGKPEFLDEC